MIRCAYGRNIHVQPSTPYANVDSNPLHKQKHPYMPTEEDRKDIQKDMWRVNGQGPPVSQSVTLPPSTSSPSAALDSGDILFSYQRRIARKFLGL